MLDVNNESRNNRQNCHIFGAGLGLPKHFGVQKILTILCRANSTNITKDLRKVLLGLETTGHGHVQYSRIRSTQHPFGAEQIDGGSRPLTCETSARNGPCSILPIGPSRRDSSRLPSSHESTL